MEDGVKVPELPKDSGKEREETSVSEALGMSLGVLRTPSLDKESSTTVHEIDTQVQSIINQIAQEPKDKRIGAWILKFRDKRQKKRTIVFPINGQSLSLEFNWRQSVIKTRQGAFVHYWKSGYGYADEPILSARFTSGSVWVFHPEDRLPKMLSVFHEIQRMIEAPRVIGGYPNYVELYVDTPLYPGVWFIGFLSEGISIGEDAANPASFEFELRMTVIKTTPPLDRLSGLKRRYRGMRK